MSEEELDNIKSIAEDMISESDMIIDLNMKRKEKLISKIRECDSLHNNCDYLLEHNDCDDLIEYVDNLEKELQDSNRIAVERRDHILILKQKLDFALKDVSFLKKQKRELEEEILKILEGKQKHIEQLRKRNKELKGRLDSKDE